MIDDESVANVGDLYIYPADENDNDSCILDEVDEFCVITKKESDIIYFTFVSSSRNRNYLNHTAKEQVFLKYWRKL